VGTTSRAVQTSPLRSSLAVTQRPVVEAGVTNKYRDRMADLPYPADGPPREAEEGGNGHRGLSSAATEFMTVPEVHVDGGWTAQSFTPLKPTVGDHDPGWSGQPKGERNV
jgi:hypothetical protein